VLHAVAGWALGKGDLPVTLDDEWSSVASATLLERGQTYAEHDKPDSAMMCFTIVANRRFNVSDRDTAALADIAMAINDVGLIYSNFYYDFKKSREYLQRAFDMAHKHHLEQVELLILNNHAMFDRVNLTLYPDVGITTDSILHQLQQVFHRSLAVGKSVAVVTSNLANTAIEFDRVDLVTNELRQYLKIAHQDTTQKGRFATALSQIALQYGEGHYDQALQLLDATMTHDLLPYDTQWLGSVRYQVLLKMGRDNEALQQLSEIERYATEGHHELELLDVYHNFLEYYRSKGQTDSVAHYELLFLQLKDKMLNQYKMADMNRQQFLQQIEDANQRAAEHAYKSRVRGRVLWVVGACAALLAVLLTLLLHKNKQLRERNRMLYEKNEQLLAAEEQRHAQPKYHKNGMQDEDAKAMLLERVEGVMRLSDEVYGDDFSLDRLAELTQSTPNQVSQVINELRGCNFSTLVSTCRVREACRRIKDTEHYGNLTIEGIATSVGFKSRSSFSKVFKRETGLTPTDYRNMSLGDGKK